MMNSNNSINLNSIISGSIRSMTLGQVIDAFSSLFISNDPRKDQFEEVKKEMEIIPRFIKSEWYSQQILRVLQEFPCKHLVIRKDGQKVLESDNIDIWFITLMYYGAFIEDSTSNGFCWHSPANPDGEFYEADFSQS